MERQGNVGNVGRNKINRTWMMKRKVTGMILVF